MRWITTAMFGFTFVVDRVQWVIDRLAFGDRCNEMFVRRVNAELQIFGLVAISLFIGQNLMGSMPGDVTGAGSDFPVRQA